MNVYDFDGTIFYSDCSIGFAFWCMKRHPKLWFTYFPGAVKSYIGVLDGEVTCIVIAQKPSDKTEYAVKSITEPRWHLHFLAVDPKCQRQGIGSGAIQDFLIPLVRSNGGDLITVTTNSEKNVDFYISNGFSLVEEETLEYKAKSIGNWTFKMDLNEEDVK